MASPAWRAVRRRKLGESPRCAGCGGDERLEVHHLTYERLGHELMRDLRVLCHWCHMLDHGRAASGFPAAGPKVAELSERVRERESLVRRQRQVVEAGPLFGYADAMRALVPQLPTKRTRDRAKSIVREFEKLAQEHIAA
jgi:hypothetical protein